MSETFTSSACMPSWVMARLCAQDWVLVRSRSPSWAMDWLGYLSSAMDWLGSLSWAWMVLGREVRQGSPGELMVESSPSRQRRPPCKTNKEMSDEAAAAAPLTYLLTLSPGHGWVRASLSEHGMGHDHLSQGLDWGGTISL